MYKSPIELIYSDINHKIDDKIYAAIVSVGVNVDKDELVRALRYDRNQYEEGYVDGITAFVERLKEKATPKYPWLWQVDLDEIIAIAKEMTG
jgi:hypothetical protein